MPRLRASGSVQNVQQVGLRPAAVRGAGRVDVNKSSPDRTEGPPVTFRDPGKEVAAEVLGDPALVRRPELVGVRMAGPPCGQPGWRHPAWRQPAVHRGGGTPASRSPAGPRGPGWTIMSVVHGRDVERRCRWRGWASTPQRGRKAAPAVQFRAGTARRGRAAPSNPCQDAPPIARCVPRRNVCPESQPSRRLRRAFKERSQ